jgi:hypothetical protein
MVHVGMAQCVSPVASDRTLPGLSDRFNDMDPAALRRLRDREVRDEVERHVPWDFEPYNVVFDPLAPTVPEAVGMRALLGQVRDRMLPALLKPPVGAPRPLPRLGP